MNEIEAVKAVVNIMGGQVSLAGKLGISQGTVSGWITRDKRVGAGYALRCHLLTGGKVTVHDLRPDLYPKGVVKVLANSKAA